MSKEVDGNGGRGCGQEGTPDCRGEGFCSRVGFGSGATGELGFGKEFE